MLDISHLFVVTAPADWIGLALIYASAAVISGLSGFGFAAIGALSLIYLPPVTAISMLMLLSLSTQALSFGRLWGELRTHSQRWNGPEGVLPYCAGGILGIPIGIEIMTVANEKELMFFFGLALMLYSAYGLLKPTTPYLHRAAGWRSSLLVGACGGLVGGITAFPGSVLVIWTSLIGLSKQQARALTQPFVFFMQLVGLAVLVLAHPHVFTVQLLTLFAVMAPLALAGSWLGVNIYQKTSQVNYRNISFMTLAVSGLGLLLKLGLSSPA